MSVAGLVGRHLTRYALPVYAPGAFAISPYVNAWTGRSEAFREAFGRGLAEGAIGDVRAGETLGERGTRLSQDAASSIPKGVLGGLGDATSSILGALKPWHAVAAASTVALPLVITHLLNKYREKKKEGEIKTAASSVLGRILNSAWQTPRLRTLRTLPLAVTAAGTAVPVGVAAHKLTQAPEGSVIDLAIKRPEEVADRLVAGVASNTDKLLNHVITYPLREPLKAGAVLAAYGLGMYGLYRLLRRNEEQKPQVKEAAAVLGKLIAASIPVSLGTVGVGSMLAPTATGSTLGSATGKGLNIATVKANPQLKDFIQETVDSIAPVGGREEEMTSNIHSAISSPVRNFVRENPTAAGMIPAAALAVLSAVLYKNWKRKKTQLTGPTA